MTLGDRFDAALDGARQGDEAGFAHLYRDTAPLVIGYARAKGARDPEDVAQEVFTAMASQVSSFVGDERSFRSWLLTIAHRRVVDDLRRRSRRPLADIDERELLDRPASTSAADEALGRLEASGVLRAIDGLTDDQRSVLLLRMLADLPIKEIAAVVGKPESAVKALLRRALATLGRRLDLETVEVDDRG